MLCAFSPGFVPVIRKYSSERMWYSLRRRELSTLHHFFISPYIRQLRVAAWQKASGRLSAATRSPMMASTGKLPGSYWQRIRNDFEESYRIRIDVACVYTSKPISDPK